MTMFQALILGLIQGITEMLPISSTAHLILLPWFMEFPDPGLAFSVALHVGTLVALILYFWKDWVAILKDVILIVKTRKVETFEQKFAGFLLVATIPGASLGLLLDEQVGSIFRSPIIIVFTLVGLGALLLYADKMDEGKRKLQDMTMKDSIVIGFSQAIALIPGVSRSGITMTAGLFRQFDREAVAKFSFMLSAPIIAGAGILKLPELSLADFTVAFWAGFIASVVSSFFAISFLLNFVKKHRFAIFAYYRFVLAGIIIIYYLQRGY